MRILSRYIVVEILTILFPVWFSLGFLLFILEWLAQVFNVRASAGTTLLLYAYKIPSHLEIVFPVAVLLSALVVLGTMNRSREIVAAQSFGMRVRSLLLPACVAVSLGAVVNFWIMNDLSPWAMRQYYELYDREVLHVTPRYSQMRQEKIWYRNKDVLYNVRYFDTEKNELYDVTIYTFDESFKIAQTIYANRATWNGRSWVLSKGVISLTDSRLSTPVSEPFATRSTRLIEEPRALKRTEFNAETMSQGELARSIERSRALGINTSRWEVVYQSRYSFFLISFVFLLISFPISLRFRRTSGYAKDGLTVAVLSMCYWLLFNFGVNMGNAGKLSPVIAAWAPSVLFMIGALLYIRTRSLAASSD
jgi:lipopolysaccharide export system permease protein